MADQDKIPANNVSADEDTKTRKTVRLRTLVPSATGPSLDGVATTAPGNSRTALAGAEDTRTRSTVPLIPNAAPPSTPAPAAEGEDTRTRVTVKLKPAMATAPLIPPAEAEEKAAPAPAPVAAPPAAAAAEGEDTRTRVTVKLKPAMATAPSISGVPASAPQDTAPKAENAVADEDTKTRRNAVLPAAAPTSANVSADDDRTVRIQRPALKKPVTAAPASVPVVPKTPVVPAVPETASSAASSEPAAAPAAPAAAAVPKVPTVPPRSVPPKPFISPMPTQQLTSPIPANVSDPGEQGNIPLPPKEETSRPSALYTIVTLVSLLLLLGSATLGVVHYLNFEHKTNIELPGIPFGK